MKTCSNCKETKSTDQFYKNRNHSTGIRNVCKLCQNTRRTENRRKNPDLARAACRRSKLKCKYGITQEQYEKMLLSQNGVCAICFNPSADDRRLHIDHCHTTNKIRGLLCHKCNNGLGIFRDNPTILQSAVDYLILHGNVPNDNHRT